MLKKYLISFILIGMILTGLYGIGRLYFRLTGGFTIANITSDFPYNPEWEVRPLLVSENEEFETALNQPYYYLGKGCQAYVFESQDRKYVIKFFKYQRYRLTPWLAYAPPLPAIVQYRKEKLEKKWTKLDGFVKSWKIAFEHLKDETGLVFVHLNKSDNLQKSLLITDKIGRQHLVNLDDMEFCIQKRADMLCTTLLRYKENGELVNSKELISNLLALIVSEYHRGLADNDHALMQNTGVAEGKPIHIDVGQFVLNEQIKDPEVYNQELFTKTYKFKIWLREFYPELADYLEAQLELIMGPIYHDLKPKFRERH